MNEKRLYIALFVALLMWSSSFPGIKASLEGYSPFELTAFRFVVASLVFASIAPWAKVRLPGRRDTSIVLAAAVASVAYQVTLNYGEIRATAGAAAFIVNSSPLWTCVLGWVFLKETLSSRAWIGMGVGLAGVWLIAKAQSGSFAMRNGTLILMLAAFCWGVFSILQKRLLTGYTPLEVCCYAVWIGSLLLSFLIPQTFKAMQAAKWQATLSAIYLGVFPTTISFLLWSYVLAHWSASRTAIYGYLIPLLSTVIAFIWVREVPTPLFLIGGMTVLAGVAFATWQKTRLAQAV